MVADKASCQVERIEARVEALEKNCTEFKVGLANIEKQLEKGFEEIRDELQLLRETIYGNGRLDSLITRVNILWFIVIGTITLFIGGGSLFAIIRIL